MSDKPVAAKACPPMLHASASNGLSDIKTHIENAPCNRPLNDNFIDMQRRTLSKESIRQVGLIMTSYGHTLNINKLHKVVTCHLNVI
jgi:hypothetical protein